MSNPKTTLSGLVLMLCGAFLVVTSRHATPDAIAILSAGAGLIAAADAKPKA